jgi:hypothetical protein
MAQIQIQADANSGKVVFGVAEIRHFSQREILFRVLKTLGLLWGIAVFCVFLPVVHFVLVPLFLILGPIFALRARKYKFELLGGEVACPQCSQILKLPKSAILWPHTEICQNCAFHIRLSPLSGM